MSQDAEIYQKHRFALVRFATALAGPDDAGDIVSAVVARVLEVPDGWAAACPRPD